jgi:PhoH-like ATPase
MKKTYVLDTNILMTSPNALFGFADNDVVITGTTLQELDAHKGDPGERGYNTRETVRLLESLRKQGSLIEGVKTWDGGCIMLEPDMVDASVLPTGYNIDVPDNRIIATVLKMGQSEKYQMPVILVTNDLSMKINASACGALVEGYRNESIESSSNEQYSGKRFIDTVTDEDIDNLYAAGKEGVGSVFTGADDLVENEYLIMKGASKSAIGIHRNGRIYIVDAKSVPAYRDIKPRNASQRMLMHALNAPVDEIPLVIAKGPAGTGKTMLAIACGLAHTYNKLSRSSNRYEDNDYDQILITRSNTISDNDLGFLPGDLEEKMSPLVAPFMDNMQTIFAGKEHDLATAKQQIDFVMERGFVRIEAVGYLRGRSISRSYLIVDEAQNLTVNQALEIVTRAGEGTKVVLLGDPNQIDARYLDKRNNGLVFTAEKMKGSPLCAQITFEEDEAQRSALCIEAAKRLTVH